jgi:hypothetical protein
MYPRIEFRIPIAPTGSFYNRVHFFCAALRRLGQPYSDALVRVVVGDKANLDKVQADNRWFTRYNLEWHGVPHELSARHHYFATSDFRYFLPEPAADLVILADADTVWVQSVVEDLNWMLRDEPCIAGHMAHAPPPVKFVGRSDVASLDLWPFLFQQFSIPFPKELYRYSMDIAGKFPAAPAYYNLGLVVLNRSALRCFKQNILEVRDRLNELIISEMRCQIAVTLLTYLYSLRRRNLPASFNAANDDAHFRYNEVRVEHIKVIHYLRKNELDRDAFLDEPNRSIFLNTSFRNPVNQLLQKLGREIFGNGLESGIKKESRAKL